MAEPQLAHAPYLTALADLTSREITEREKAVKDTMNTPGWIVLTELWGVREQALMDDLLRIPSTAAAEKYAAATAHIKGLREAGQAHHALAKVAEEKRQEALRNG